MRAWVQNLSTLWVLPAYSSPLGQQPEGQPPCLALCQPGTEALSCNPIDVRPMQLDILANNLYGSGTVEGEVLVNGAERK